MRTLKNCLWVTFIALAMAFVGCSKETVDPVEDPNIENPGTTADSVIIEVTITTPECVILTEAVVKLYNPLFPEGLLSQVNSENKRVYTFVSKEKKLIGQDCMCSALLLGMCNDNAACLVYNGSDYGKNITLKKGLNKVTLEFLLKE